MIGFAVFALRDRRGMAALQYAVAAPALMLMLFGMVDMGRLAWTSATLDFAASAAARCAAFNATDCATDAHVKTYAADHAYGMTLSSAAFSVTSAACGRQVTASRAFSFMSPVKRSFTLQASACYPLQPA